MVSRQNTWLLALAVVLASTVFHLTPITEYLRGFDSDGRYYAAMAGAPGFPPRFSREAPFCHRVLTPWIVAQMPGPVLERFQLLGLLSSVVNLFLVALLVRQRGADALVAGIAMLLYAGVFWTVKFVAYSPAYIDFQTQTFVLVFAILAPIPRARWWLVPVFALGVLQKEAMLAFLPVALYAAYQREKLSAGWTALVVGLPLAAWFAVHVAVPQANTYQPTDALQYLRQFGEPGYGLRLFHSAIVGLGLLPLVALLRPGVVWRTLHAEPWWGVWAVISGALLFGGIGKGRVFLYVLPFFLVLAVAVVTELKRTMPRALFFAWIAATVAVHAWLGHHLEPMETFRDYIVRMVPVFSSSALHRVFLYKDLLGIAAWGVATAALLLPRSPGVRRLLGRLRRNRHKEPRGPSGAVRP